MAEAANSPLVLVTGASGFISTHIIKQLQTLGKYRVRGTVRNLNQQDKVKQLQELVPDPAHPLELVEADLNKDEGWKEAVQGCTFVCHVASPFVVSAPRDENELINPAVNGTLRVLRAVSESGTVKRVVLTSSGIAIEGLDVNHVYTEADWASDDNNSGAYQKSKVRAERAAWDFVEKLDDDKKFELAVINPTFVMGPFLMKSISGSSDVVKGFLTKETPMIPDLSFGVIHVSDVATAHITAMEIPEAAGNRHYLVERSMTMKEIAAVISQEFTPQGYNVTSMSLPKALAWPLKFFNTDIKTMYPAIGKHIQRKCDRMRDVLKIDPIDASKGIIEACYSLIEMGVVAKKPGYRGPPSE